MRFDDSLKTVLAADASTDFGARAAFRQIADLLARRRIDPTDDMLDRLRSLRAGVSADLRSAVARSLAIAAPPAALVAFFAEDEPAVASAALRAARLGDAEWIDLLPRLGPTGRSVLRGRTDLGDPVTRALESFGATDFSLSYDAPPVPKPVAVDQPTAPPVGTGPFVSLGKIAETLPIVAEARRRADEPSAAAPRFEIAELVDRIAAFQRAREPGAELPAVERHDDAAAVSAFRFETDAEGMIRWIDASPRGAVIGLSFAHPAADGLPHVDGVAGGAFRRRTMFTDARLSVGGASALAGDWRISGVPAFDHATGRFTGFRGAARRPRADEDAAGNLRPSNGASEGLRRLVHELRTPTNAIAGFSELIESQLLGPVSPIYRERAATIRTHAADLIAAIEDLDIAARIEGDALELRGGELALAPLLARLAGDLAPLAVLRGCTIDIAPVDDTLLLGCDDRVAERLLSRLLAALVSAGGPGERIAVGAHAGDAGLARIDFTRPATLAAVPDAALLSLDAEREADLPGAPLLGTGFALRLARNLASELGGSLMIGATRLTLTLPAALIGGMGWASTI
ncbi:sensor histidine kinase [Sphingomonas sp. SUN019]|uniref:histidine kinase dimerization/phospho-acceptor domain-containing protein n=1 Tax=Sphingomonas sp. SUN019 TaxID=2937788 RepID=UPI0021645277|nr:histidine kinase dimerization/phospho-acceptor domain-containing protein [Sphingomonas sp. SUN019]UVO49153.1 sensor histidine kinase [Sphingomonas sp. SUN019]